MNSHVNQLVRFANELAQRRRNTGGDIELVINGDFVDFLAEAAPGDGQHHAFVGDQTQAAAVFKAIVERDRPFFDALRELLATGVPLTLVLGNHDVELSLPAVRAYLEYVLGAEAYGGFRFVYDGEAYVIGDVLIEHGNRYDGWNVVDHDRLRRHRSEVSRRLPVSADARFTPPAGSMMVERVMNPIKHEYPFVDLLKPETDAALPLLLALEPRLAGVANAIEVLRLHGTAQEHQVAAPARPARPGDIAAGGAATAAYPALRELLSQQLGAREAETLIELASQARAAEIASSKNIAASGISQALSFLRLRASPAYETRLKILLSALRALRDDTSFKRDVEGEAVYREAAARLAEGGFAVIVFGHTHLAKQVKLAGGRSIYLNTGTWADLIRVPDEIISGPESAAPAYLESFAQALRDRQLDPYLLYCPTYAHIVLDAQGHARSADLKDYTVGCLEAS